MDIPITLWAGITFEQSYRITNSGPNNTEVPVNLTGKTVRFRVRQAFGLEFILDSGAGPGVSFFGSEITITDATDGRVTVKLTDEQTARLLNQGSYRVEALEPSGDVRLLFEGSLNYKP